MSGKQDDKGGPDRRQGDRRQQQVANLPFPDRRTGNRRTGEERRSHDRD